MSRDPVPLGESLNGLVRSLRGPSAEAAGATAMGGVFGRWNETVGEAVARHVQPVKLDGGTLVVEVDDPAWATQLKFLEANLRERLLDSTGARIDTFEIRVRRPTR
ncbi:MAG: DciA family protein [Ilumatobacteraceae bacterium]